MDVARSAIESIFTDIVESVGYKTTVGPIDKKKVTERLAGQLTTQPRARLARAAWRAAGLLSPAVPAPPGPSGPTGPPPPVKRYAPRTHNLGNRDQDPRFCCKAEYGVKIVDHPQHGRVFQDEMGACYDLDKMLNVDGLRDRAYIVPGLKGADSMDGMEPCDPYSANGISVPPYPGDPAAQTGSYHR